MKRQTSVISKMDRLADREMCRRRHREQPDRAPVYANRPFRRYMAGYGLSMFGDHMWFLALGWAASGLGSPVLTSVVMAIASIPRAGLLLFGGVIVDRYGALRTALSSQRLRIAVMAATAAATLAMPDAIAVLITVALLFGIFDAAHMPAIAALPPQLLDHQDLPAGQGIVQTLQRITAVLGAPLAGFLVIFGGLSLAAATIALVLTLAMLALTGIRRHITAHPGETEKGTPRGLRAEMLAGLRYAATDSAVGSILLVVAVLNLALAGPLTVGVALLTNNRAWGAAGLGFIIAGFSVGATIGALALTGRYRPLRPAAAGLRWVLAGSVCIVLLPLFDNLFATTAIAAAAGLTAGPASALLLGLVQARTNVDHLGRITALINFSGVGLVPLSYTLFGLLTSATTLTIAFAVCASFQAAAAITAYAITAVRTAALTPAGMQHRAPARQSVPSIEPFT